MKDRQLDYCCAAIAKIPILRKVKILLKDVGAQLPLTESGNPVIQDFFAPQFYQVSVGGFALLCFNQNALLDVRIALEGEEVVIGVPWADLTGDTIAAKTEAFESMQVSTLMLMAAKSGFTYVTKPSQALVIPNRFATVSVNRRDDTAHGLRYQTLGDKEQVKIASEVLTQAYSSNPDFASSSMGALKVFLDTKLV